MNLNPIAKGKKKKQELTFSFCASGMRYGTPPTSAILGFPQIPGRI